MERITIPSETIEGTVWYDDHDDVRVPLTTELLHTRMKWGSTGEAIDSERKKVVENGRYKRRWVHYPELGNIISITDEEVARRVNERAREIATASLPESCIDEAKTPFYHGEMLEDGEYPSSISSWSVNMLSSGSRNLVLNDWCDVRVEGKITMGYVLMPPHGDGHHSGIRITTSETCETWEPILSDPTDWSLFVVAHNARVSFHAPTSFLFQQFIRRDEVKCCISVHARSNK